MFNKIFYITLHLLLIGFVAAGADEHKALDESDKVWVYDKSEDAVMFIKKGGRYIRGELKIELSNPATKTTLYPNGSYQTASSVQGNSKVVLTFFPSTVSHTKRNVVASSRIYLNVEGNYMLHDYMRVFTRAGELTHISKWTQGELDGEFKVFTNDGRQLLEIGNYSSGIPIGEWKQFYPTGELASKVIFPMSLFDWSETENYVKNEALPESTTNLNHTLYLYPKIIFEEWYSKLGYRFKEIEYEVYANKTGIVIERTGNEKSWDSKGHLVNESKRSFEGLTQKEEIKKHHHTYISKKIWWGKHHFKKFDIKLP